MAERSLSLFRHLPHFFSNRGPGQLIIQYTDRCNARCPQCSMRVTEPFRRTTLDSDSVKRIIDHAAENGIEALSITGGEPLLFFDEIMGIVKYATEAGIRYVRTGTNGFMFAGAARADYDSRIARMAEAMAETGLYTFWISMDSAVSGVHEEMRGLPDIVSGIGKALPIFHKHGIYPAANLGINRNIGGPDSLNTSTPLSFHETLKESFRKFYCTVIDLGFTMVNSCYPMSIDNAEGEGLNAAYKATSAAPVVRFSTDEKALVFKALFDVIPEFRPKIRIFSPRSSLYSLTRQYSVDDAYCYPCRGGTDFFFISAHDGNTYPCGYRGKEDLGKFWDLNLRKIRQNAVCKKCDWECFRDPSELLGPLLDLFSRPLRLLERTMRDTTYMKLVIEDYRYYSACNYFDGRTAPDYKRLATFVPKVGGTG